MDKEYHHNYYINHREYFYRKNKEWRKLHRSQENKFSREYNRRTKEKVFQRYGGIRCACCGETNIVFLTIDHINGGGVQHRRAIKNKGGVNFYHYLAKNNFPSGYQVLCFNCNAAKSILGQCPHQRQTSDFDI